MTVQEVQYILTQLEHEQEWYRRCLELLTNEIQITHSNLRVTEITNQIIRNKRLVEEKIEKFEKAIAQAKINIEGK